MPEEVVQQASHESRKVILYGDWVGDGELGERGHLLVHRQPHMLGRQVKHANRESPIEWYSGLVLPEFQSMVRVPQFTGRGVTELRELVNRLVSALLKKAIDPGPLTP